MRTSNVKVLGQLHPHSPAEIHNSSLSVAQMGISPLVPFSRQHGFLICEQLQIFGITSRRRVSKFSNLGVRSGLEVLRMNMLGRTTSK